MVTGWVRVGFAQGNFNADNCLVGGKTMDYGPFGWMEEFSPLFAKWTGSGKHFGFLNQPNAGFVNYQVLVESVVPVITSARVSAEGGTEEETFKKLVEDFMAKAQIIFNQKTESMFNIKMGLPEDADAGEELWESLTSLLSSSRTDWTLFWRQLSYVVRDTDDLDSEDYEAMVKKLEGNLGSESSPFYEPLTPEIRREWLQWMKDWSDVLKATKRSSKEVYQQMKTNNPKFVLREWMLAEAYSSTAADDSSTLDELFQLIKYPYDEGSPQQIESYYRRAPETSSAKGGIAFMS
jgi:uncharacterized protein YdiU (UPF0061 family)